MKTKIPLKYITQNIVSEWMTMCFPFILFLFLTIFCLQLIFNSSCLFGQETQRHWLSLSTMICTLDNHHLTKKIFAYHILVSLISFTTVYLIGCIKVIMESHLLQKLQFLHIVENKHWHFPSNFFYHYWLYRVVKEAIPIV